jgi:lactoylglutathione lyase
MGGVKHMLGQKVKLFVADLNASVAFYRDALGFEEVAHREVQLSGKMLSHTILKHGPVILSLGLRDRLPDGHHLLRSDGEQGLGVELCFYVPDEDLETMFARVTPIAPGRVDPLAMRPWGNRDFRVSDPDGYYIRIGAPDEELTVA